MSGIAGACFPMEPLWLPVFYSRVVSGAPGIQSVRFQQNGAFEANQNGVIVQLGLWNANRVSSITNQFEFMLQVTSGVWTGNTPNTWLSFAAVGTSIINWFCSGTPSFATGIVQLRRIGSTETLRSCNVSLTNNP